MICADLGGRPGLMGKDVADREKARLDAAWTGACFIGNRELGLILRTIRTNAAGLTPVRLAGMLDEFEDRGFLSAAQAAELLQAIRAAGFDNRQYQYWHVICARRTE